VSPLQRADVYKHSSKFVVITGLEKVGKRNIAKALEQKLFDNNFKAYYLGITNIEHGLYSDIIDRTDIFEERIRRLGELARIITDSGQIFITTIDDADDFDIEKLKLLNEPNEILVINVGNSNLNKFPVNLILDANEKPDVAVEKIFQLLKEKEIILEYYL
jgi:bifunctional enzyme CysN/CysC